MLAFGHQRVHKMSVLPRGIEDVVDALVLVREMKSTMS